MPRRGWRVNACVNERHDAPESFTLTSGPTELVSSFNHHQRVLLVHDDQDLEKKKWLISRRHRAQTKPC